MNAACRPPPCIVIVSVLGSGAWSMTVPVLGTVALTDVAQFTEFVPSPVKLGAVDSAGGETMSFRLVSQASPY